MAEKKKCDNAPCDCVATDGSSYCGAYCAGAAEGTGLLCHCGHLDCSADVTDVKNPEALEVDNPR
jgi:hypothetical protein